MGARAHSRRSIAAAARLWLRVASVARVPFRAVNAFHLAGGLLALWAVVLAALGITRPGFPGKGGERAITAVSAVLVASAIVAAVVTGVAESEEKEAAEGGEPTAAAEGLRVSADRGGQLAFSRDSLEASAGSVTIEMDNPARIRHNVAIEGNGVEVEGQSVDPGGTSTVSADLEPGVYEFYCSVLGHREGGMTGTLTVR